MNLHPFLVHFPIALLSIYSVLEVLPFEKWYARVSWKDIKAFLVIFGGVGLLAALGSGVLSEGLLSLTPDTAKILHIHKLFAGTSAAIFGIIAAAYLIQWVFEKHERALGSFGRNFSFLHNIADFILNRWIIIPLAVIGFFVLLITGILGTTIVYGPQANIVTQFIYTFFFG